MYNPLEGKILVTVGDSITEGADMDPAGFAPDGTRMTYGWQIAQRNNMTFYNRGISGTTMQHIEGKANCFSTEGGRYTQLPDEIDYLTIFFGWNDAHFGNLGTIKDRVNTTYYGGYNVVLPYLIEKYPDARICLIVPFGGTVEHRDAVRQLANKWGVACFDLCGPGTPFLYTKEEEVGVDPWVVSFRHKQYFARGCHPGYKGHCLMGRALEHFLRGI